MMKQYVIKESYTNNYTVTQYNYGEVERIRTLSIWDLNGYIQAIENDGYTRAYEVREYLRKFQEAVDQYNHTFEEYKMALQSPLCSSEEERKVYYLLWESINGES